MKFRSLLFVLLVLITLISASAQDSATEATSAGPDDNSADVDDKPDDVVYEEGKDTDKPDDFVDTGDKPDDVVYEEGKDTDKPDDFVDTGDNCLDENVDQGKYEECKQLGMIVETITDENGCKMTACTKEDEITNNPNCDETDIDNGKTAECEASGKYAQVDTDPVSGCKMIVCKELEGTTDGTETTDNPNCDVDFDNGKTAECTDNDMFAQADIDPVSGCKIIVCKELLEVGETMCPTDAELVDLEQMCLDKGAVIGKITDSNGCTVIDCKEPLTGEVMCPTDAELVDLEQMCLDKGAVIGKITDSNGCTVVDCKEPLTEDSTEGPLVCPSEAELTEVVQGCEDKGYEADKGTDDNGCDFVMCKDPQTGQAEETSETTTTCTVSKDADCVKVTCDEIGFIYNSCEGQSGDVPMEDKKPATKLGEWIKGFFKSDDKGAGDVMGLEEPVE